MDIVTIEQVMELEQAYCKACDELGSMASGAIDAFRIWYGHARALFSRYFAKDNEDYSAFINEYPGGRSYAYQVFYRNVYPHYVTLLDTINSIDNDVDKRKTIVRSNEVFIVHGHDLSMRDTVDGFLKRIGLKPVILANQSNEGRTLIEKFEQRTLKIDYAVVLFSDQEDVGRAHNETVLKSRARQNVILELGYFIGKLGRSRVCVLKKGNVEPPSDIHGFVSIDYEQTSSDWQKRVVVELQAAGYSVDGSKI